MFLFKSNAKDETEDENTQEDKNIKNEYIYYLLSRHYLLKAIDLLKIFEIGY